MNDLIERYVYDVTRRLPEKDRDEVSRELRANINDMLPDDAGQEDIAAVLRQLGPPSRLAGNYRQSQRYLISPAIYEDYIHAIKWILPLVGTILLFVGLILGLIDALSKDTVEMTNVISQSLSRGISLAFSAVLQAWIWTTIGFVIAERTGKASKIIESAWKPEDLPGLPPSDRKRIPLADSVAELVITILFSAAAILFCLGVIPAIIINRSGSTQAMQLFDGAFLIRCIPVIAILAVFAICECSVKIIHRRWTPSVCAAVIIKSIADIVTMLYILSSPAILSAEFTDYIAATEWGSVDLMRFMGKSVDNPVILTIGAIVIVAGLANCAGAIFKTLGKGK